MYVQDGQTTLYIACWKGHLPVVRLLLQKHADDSICDTVYHVPVYPYTTSVDRGVLWVLEYPFMLEIFYIRMSCQYACVDITCNFFMLLLTSL